MQPTIQDLAKDLRFPLCDGGGVGSDEHAPAPCQLHALCPALHATAQGHVQVSLPPLLHVHRYLLI